MTAASHERRQDDTEKEARLLQMENNIERLCTSISKLEENLSPFIQANITAKGFRSAVVFVTPFFIVVTALIGLYHAVVTYTKHLIP